MQLLWSQYHNPLRHHLDASPLSQARFRKVMTMALWWAQKHFPVAVKLAVENGAEFPEAIDGLSH